MTMTRIPTKVGVFSSRTAADKAIADLKKAGFSDGQIGLIAKDERGTVTQRDGTGMTKAEEGALGGAAVGAAAGAAVGAGIVAGIIPVIGPVLALGTLGTVLVNAAGGAVATSLGGALVGWGLTDKDATYYENEVQAGRYLVTVAPDVNQSNPEEYMVRHGGYSRTSRV